MSSDRTEKPSQRRIRDARRKGQVVRSRDVVQAGTLAAALIALGWAGQWMVGLLGHAVRDALVQLDRFPGRDLSVGELQSQLILGLGRLLLVVAPVALTAMISVVAFSVAQSGFVVATEALKPNWGKLNPVNGFKRLGFSAGGIDTLKMMVLVTALTYISYRIIHSNLEQSSRFARMSPLQASAAGWADLSALLRQCALAMVIVAGADYAIQRWRLMKSLKMTKQEVKDEAKLTEGNPEIKARVRRIQMTMARKRMLAAVPKATVVVTNPTHFAVALEYRRSSMAAPRVLAKGRGHLAQRIKAIARDHGVPMVENVPLAQALYKTVEVGDFIPAELFEAVAEVLAYLIRLKQLVLQ
jgi:flagellar biosynthesis protein FlhB